MLKIAGDILASEDALRAVLENMKPQQKASLWQRLKRALTSLRNKLKGQKNAKPAETQLNVLERLYKQAFAQRVIQDAVENPRVGDPNAVSEQKGKMADKNAENADNLHENEKKSQKTAEKSQKGEITRINSEKTQVSEKADIKELQNYKEYDKISAERKKGDTNNERWQKDSSIKQRSQREDDTSDERASSENEDGRRVSTTEQEKPEKNQKFTTRVANRGLKIFPDDAYIVPNNTSPAAKESKTLEKYGIECRIVKDVFWYKEKPAFTRNGVVYIRESLEKEYEGMIAPHEATHYMRQTKYEPYLDFCESIPSRLDFSSENTKDLLAHEEEHCKVSLLTGDENAFKKVYDEINATIYGNYATGDIEGELLDICNEIFYDFDSYIKELSAIHDQFKKYNTAVSKEKADVAEYEIPNSSREYAQMKREEENGGDGDKSIKTWGAKDIQLLRLKADMVKGRKVYGTDEMSQTVSRALRVLTPTLSLI